VRPVHCTVDKLPLEGMEFNQWTIISMMRVSNAIAGGEGFVAAGVKE